MELSSEKENYIKLAYILLEIVPGHLRKYFIKLWDNKYPNEKWQDDTAKRNRKLQSLLVTGNMRKNQDIYSRKLLDGNEEKWDITTLIHAILHPDLQLIRQCRPKTERTHPLLESEEIDIIRDMRNSSYAHVDSMSCTNNEFNTNMVSIKRVAKNVFGENAEKEIEDIANSRIIPLLTRKVNELLKSKLSILPMFGPYPSPTLYCFLTFP